MIEGVADRMFEVGRNLTEEEARAFMVVYASSEVLDEQGKLIGYWVSGYHPIAEYEQLRAKAVALVEKVEAER